jgi:hypothetical protein
MPSLSLMSILALMLSTSAPGDLEDVLGKRLPPWKSNLWTVWQTFPMVRVRQPTGGGEELSPYIFESHEPGYDITFLFGDTGLAMIWVKLRGQRAPEFPPPSPAAATCLHNGSTVWEDGSTLTRWGRHVVVLADPNSAEGAMLRELTCRPQVSAVTSIRTMLIRLGIL